MKIDWVYMVIAALPSAIVGFGIWMLKRQIEKNAIEERADRERRLRNEKFIVDGLTASIALGEATARAVQRIPDAKCNGDMRNALEMVAKVKKEQRDFFKNTALETLY